MSEFDDGGEDAAANLEEFILFSKTMMELSGYDPELRDRVLDEMRATQDSSTNIVLVGTDGECAVTIIHVDRELLGGKDGPVLFPTADKKTVLAAVSRQMLQTIVDVTDELEPSEADARWEELMEALVSYVMESHRQNPQLI